MTSPVLIPYGWKKTISEWVSFMWWTIDHLNEVHHLKLDQQRIPDTPRSPSPSQINTENSSGSTVVGIALEILHRCQPEAEVRFVRLHQKGSDNSIVVNRASHCHHFWIGFRCRLTVAILIGRSEFYVRRLGRYRGCPLCGLNHRMYRCEDFRNSTLQDRWINVLYEGVRLNCLRLEHSSFTCIKEDACVRCK